jgi:hypothetical protein
MKKQYQTIMKPFLALAVVAMAAVGCSKDFLEHYPSR